MKTQSLFMQLLACENESKRVLKPNLLNQLFKDKTIMTNDKQFIDQLDENEIAVIMQEIEEESYHGLKDPKTGKELSADVAKKRVNAAKQREKRIQRQKQVETRKKLVHNRATKAMQKRAKKSARKRK